MPEAHSILWFMGVFLACWGLSLIARGFLGDRRGPRRCPQCRASLAHTPSLLCHSCAFEARCERDVRAPVRNRALIGGGLFATMVAAFPAYAGVRVYEWAHGDPDTLWPSFWNAGALSIAAFSCAVIVWAVRGDRSRGRRRCPACWYDMAGVGCLRCPECGREAQHSRELYRSRRRWRWAGAGLVGLLAAAILTEWPRYRAGGLPALFPTAALIAGAWTLPDSLIFENPPRGSGCSLEARIERHQLSRWELDWLRHRTRAVFGDPPSPRVLRRAAIFDGHLRGWTGAPSCGGAEACARWITQSDPRLRRTAAREMRDVSWLLGPPLAPAGLELHRPALEAAVSDPDPNVALLAGRLLAHLPGDHDAEARQIMRLWPTLPATDQPLCRYVLSLLAGQGPSGASHATIAGWLGSKDSGERSMAAMAVRERAVSDPEVQAMLVRLLDDPDDSVAVAAAESLCNPGLPHVGPSVVRAASAREDAGTRVKMFTALTWLADPRDQGPAELGAALSAETDVAVQVAIGRALETMARGGANITPALPALRALRTSPAPPAAQAAEDVLTIFKERQPPPPDPPTPPPSPPSPP